MSFGDQRAAELLAICNDIGEAAYLDSQVAAQLLEIVRRLPCKYTVLQRLESRYGFSFQDEMSGELICTSFEAHRLLSICLFEAPSNQETLARSADSQPQTLTQYL